MARMTRRQMQTEIVRLENQVLAGVKSDADDRARAEVAVVMSDPELMERVIALGKRCDDLGITGLVGIIEDSSIREEAGSIALAIAAKMERGEESRRPSGG